MLQQRADNRSSMFCFEKAANKFACWADSLVKVNRKSKISYKKTDADADAVDAKLALRTLLLRSHDDIIAMKASLLTYEFQPLTFYGNAERKEE